MNLAMLSDEELHISNLNAADDERAKTLNVLKHLVETERRRLYSKYDCDSLHAYCVKHMKLSEDQAGRHVASARLLRELPVIEEKVLSGALTFTSVCQASSFFNRERASGNNFDRSVKLEILETLGNQPTRNVDRILLACASAPEIHVRESVKQRTESITEIKILADEALVAELDRLKEIWSHAMPGATYSQVIARAARLAREAHDPEVKAKRSMQRSSKRSIKLSSTRSHYEAPQRAATPAPESKRELDLEFASYMKPQRTRYIAAAIRNNVWRRDQGKCTFVDKNTKSLCGSRRFLQLDHIVPFANGGEHSERNLRLRCHAHNQRHAIECFGQ